MVLIMCFRFQAGINKSSFASITSERGRFSVGFSLRTVTVASVIVEGIALISRVD